jgi:hypothetical protein
MFSWAATGTEADGMVEPGACKTKCISSKRLKLAIIEMAKVNVLHVQALAALTSAAHLSAPLLRN